MLGGRLPFQPESLESRADINMRLFEIPPLVTGDSPKLHVGWREGVRSASQGTYVLCKQVREKYSDSWVIVMNGILFISQIRPGKGCNI